ncbi:MAG: mechanosensitive ion channel [Synechococcaceae cyanobacterium SM2_3_1]|nr:mechanosensitive ion channel [Synechococcaceae cyanobacterium SM2_3_1]
MNNFFVNILDSIDFALNRELFQLGMGDNAQPISIVWLIQLFLTFLILTFIGGRLKTFLRNRLLLRLKIDEGNREIIATLISYIFSIAGALFILQNFGISLGSLGLIAGGLGIGAGLGLQDITKNIISGLTILFEGNLKAGNFIEFNGLTGYIRSISLRSTIIRNLDGGDMIVPNSTLVEGQILNWSYDTLSGRIQVPVGVAYGSNPLLVTEVLLNSAYMDEDVLQDPPPRVVFEGFGDHSLNFSLLVWISNMEKQIFARSSLRYIIEHNLRQHGIEIPFPQTELWLRNPEVLFPNIDYPQSSGSNKPDQIQIESQIPLLGQLLKQVDYFQSCSDLDILKLVELGYRRFLQADETLLRQGQQDTSLYVVLTGTLQSWIEAGAEPIETFTIGDFFGEISLLLGMPCPTTIKAQTASTLFAIDKPGLQKFLKIRPEFAERIAAELATQRERLQAYQESLLAQPVTTTSESPSDLIRWIQQRVQRLFTS